MCGWKDRFESTNIPRCLKSRTIFNTLLIHLCRPKLCFRIFQCIIWHWVETCANSMLECCTLSNQLSWTHLGRPILCGYAFVKEIPNHLYYWTFFCSMLGVLAPTCYWHSQVQKLPVRVVCRYLYSAFFWICLIYNKLGKRCIESKSSILYNIFNVFLRHLPLLWWLME